MPTEGLKTIGGFAAPRRLPRGTSYDTIPKSERGPNGELILHDPAIAGPVFRTNTVTHPTLGDFTSSAEARARIELEELPNNRIRVAAAGSFATVDKSGSRFDADMGDFFRAPDVKAASLVRDPLSFMGIEAGDNLTGEVILPASDFRFVVETDVVDNDLVSWLFEVGTDIAGPDADLPGSSTNGLPLMFRLAMRFNSNGTAGAVMDVHEDLLMTGGLQIIDPADGSDAFSSPDVASDYVAEKLLSELQFDATSSTFSLANDLELFNYQVRATGDMSQANVDLLNGNVVITSIPEPSTAVLSAIGLMMIVCVCRQRHLNISCSKSS